MGKLKNRQWLLKSRPKGQVATHNFDYHETEIDPDQIDEGNFLIENQAFLCAPTMRNWMDPPSKNLYPSISIGTPILAPAVGKIIESNNEQFPIGSRVSTLSSWQDYEQIDPSGRPVNFVPEELSYIESIGKFGLNSLTGYFGLTKVGLPKAGETVVISAAAGATGSLAAQVAKIFGCRTIGIAGGREKCAWLSREINLDGVLDYKVDDLNKGFAQLCPNGIDVYFDNVGGVMLRNAVNHMAKFGRIVLCGQISTYDSDQAASGPEDLMRLIYGSIRMEGFLTRNYTTEFPEAIKQLREWEKEGSLRLKEDIRTGFDNLPKSYLDLFTGQNKGTLVVNIRPD